MRFLADENVSGLVVERLRANDLEVTFIAEAGSGATDRDVLELANTKGCILITEDRDFGEMVIRQRLGVNGVILLDLDRLSNSAEADRVAEIVSIHAGKLSGNLVVVEPARVRLRALPR